MWDCNGTGAQQWTFVNGTMRAGGKCMDVAWASPNDGAVIQLVGCNGNRAQQFVLSGAGDLVSVLANKCVDITDWNGNSGARLQHLDVRGDRQSEVAHPLTSYSRTCSKCVSSANSSKRCWIPSRVRSRRPSTENCSTAKLAITLPMIIAVRIVRGARSPAYAR